MKRLIRRHKPYDVMDEVGALITLLADLPGIIAEGDNRKLSVLIDQIKQDYPDIYKFCAGQVDKSPGEALAALCGRWPKFGLIKLYPAHIAVIGVIQSQIKQRRDNAGQN